MTAPSVSTRHGFLGTDANAVATGMWDGVRGVTVR